MARNVHANDFIVNFKQSIGTIMTVWNEWKIQSDLKSKSHLRSSLLEYKYIQTCYNLQVMIDGELMLGHRLRRLPDSKPTFYS